MIYFVTGLTCIPLTIPHLCWVVFDEEMLDVEPHEKLLLEEDDWVLRSLKKLCKF